MEFFRKYQRPILFTAGIFALLTFSVTGPILSWADSLMRPELPRPKMQVDGRTVEVSDEDFEVARLLVRRQRSLDPTIVMPPLFDQRADTNLQDVFAALRRLAIEFGVESSEDEADRAIEQGVRLFSQLPERAEVQTGHDLARALGYASYGAYRSVVAEALRISNFVRIQALAAFPSDAALVEKLLEDRELLTLRAIAISTERLKEQIEAENGGVDDDALREWLDDLPMGQKNRFTGANKVRVQAATIDVEAFDPTAFAEELDGFEVAASDVDSFYELNKSRLYTVPVPPKDGEEKDDEKKDGESKDETGEDPKDGDQPADEPQDPETEAPKFQELDEALRARITKRLQAAQVIRELWPSVEERYDAYMADARAAVDAASEPLRAARAEQLAAESALAEARIARDEAQAWAAREDATEEQKAAVATAEAAFEAAQEALEAATEAADTRVEELQEEVDAAVEAAEEALAARQADFDLAGVWAELANGRAGFAVVSSGDEAVEVTELREFPELGTWQGNFTVNALTNDRPFSTDVQHVDGKAFGVRLVELDQRPLKPMDDIRDEARSEYLLAKAKERAEELAETVETALDEQARARVADEIAAIEAKRDADLEERFAEWKSDKEAKLEDARTKLAQLEATQPGMRVTQNAKAFVDELEGELAKADERRESMLEELQAEADTEIEELIVEQYPAILGEVAAAAGLEVQTFGPYARDLQQQPRPRPTWPAEVQFLWWNAEVRELDAGESTDLLEDTATGSRYVAVAEAVAPATIEQITRRDLKRSRIGEAASRYAQALLQSFSIEGLKDRYGYQEPRPVNDADQTPSN